MDERRQSYLLFSSGEMRYAVATERAAEVVSFTELVRVPGSPAHLRGVFVLRGEVIPVIDLGILLGATPDSSKRAVLVRISRGLFALTATKVAGVSAVSGRFEPLGESGLRKHLLGPARAEWNEDEVDVALIDPEGLFELLSEKVLHSGP